MRIVANYFVNFDYCRVEDQGNRFGRDSGTFTRSKNANGQK